MVRLFQRLRPTDRPTERMVCEWSGGDVRDGQGWLVGASGEGWRWIMICCVCVCACACCAFVTTEPCVNVVPL